MKLRFIFLLTLLTTVLQLSHGQNRTMRAITGNVLADLQTFFPDATVKAMVMDSIRRDPDKIAIVKKYQASIQEHKDWYMDYARKAVTGKPLPYHPFMGITESEYAEMNDYLMNIEALPSTTEALQIMYSNAVIHFGANGKLTPLNNVAISLERNAVRVGKAVLTFTDSIQVKNDRNALRSAWSGYSWRYDDPAPGDPEYIQKIEDQNIKSYQFTIGVLEKNSYIFMQVKGTEIREGFMEVNFDIPILF